MAAKLPNMTFPPPISILANPFVLVLGTWVSTYTAVPLAEPCKILIRIPTEVLVTSAFEPLRMTA